MVTVTSGRVTRGFRDKKGTEALALIPPVPADRGTE